jgi:hypothetical protein
VNTDRQACRHVEKPNGIIKARVDIQGEIYFSGSRVGEIGLSNTALAVYEGRFRSAELDAAYSLSLEQEMLTLRNRENPPDKLIPIAPDEFDAGALGRVVFHRDSNGLVSSLTVFTQEVRGIECNRIN